MNRERPGAIDDEHPRLDREAQVSLIEVGTRWLSVRGDQLARAIPR